MSGTTPFSVSMTYSQAPFDTNPTVFKATFNSYDEMNNTYKFLRNTFHYEPRLEFNRSHRKPITWCKKVGECVPLHLDMINHRIYQAIIRFEDPSYLKYYTDDLSFGAKLNRHWGGWMVTADQMMDAREFVKIHNKASIPQSDTIEWDAWYEPSQETVYFFPYIPGCTGDMKEGDVWSKTGGVWDDVVRGFAFSEEEWDDLMGFHGYQVMA
jgi:hypothetical protein